MFFFTSKHKYLFQCRMCIGLYRSFQTVFDINMKTQCIQFPAFIMKEENEIFLWIKTCLSRSTNHKCIGFLSLIHLDGENLCLKWIWIYLPMQCNVLSFHHSLWKRKTDQGVHIFSVSIIGRKYIFEYRKRNINENTKKKYNWKGRWRNVVFACVSWFCGHEIILYAIYKLSNFLMFID